MVGDVKDGTVNAMLTDSSFPCTTYTKKDRMAMRMGEQTQSRENITEFVRAMCSHSS